MVGTASLVETPRRRRTKQDVVDMTTPYVLPSPRSQRLSTYRSRTRYVGGPYEPTEDNSPAAVAEAARRLADADLHLPAIEYDKELFEKIIAQLRAKAASVSAAPSLEIARGEDVMVLEKQ